MTLQRSIAATMNQVTNEIKASTQETSEAQRKLTVLKASINNVINLSPEDILLESNVRNKVDENSSEFEKLCESIKKFGLLKNVVAELHISEDEQSYKLVCVAGHRRLTALKKLGLKNRIPCLIKQYDKGDRIGAALSENLNREGLSCVDIANGYHDLMENGWNVDQIAHHFEKDKKTVARYLKIAELPQDIKDDIQKNSDIFSTRVIFIDLLSKNKLPNEIRKAIQRKLAKVNPQKKPKISLEKKLADFFKQREVNKNQQELVMNAFKFVGLLK